MMARFLLLLLIVLTMSSAESLSFTLQGRSCRMYESKNASPEKKKTLRLVFLGKQCKNKHTFQQAFVVGSDDKRPAVTSEPAVWHLGVPKHPVASMGGVNTEVERTIVVVAGLQLTDKLMRKCLHDCVIVGEDEVLAHAMAAGLDFLALRIARRVK